MTLARKVRSTVEMTFLLGLLLLGASAVSIIGMLDYRGGRSIEVYTEQVACVSLSLVMVVIVCARGALVARELYERARSDATLRAMYIYAIFPIIFVAVVLANASAYFASLLVFGLPLFLLGAVALFWAARVLEGEAMFHFWRTSQSLQCYSCGRPFFMDRSDEFVVCPWCGLVNASHSIQGRTAPPPSAPAPRGPYAHVPEEHRYWEQTTFPSGMRPLLHWNAYMLTTTGLGLLAICFVASLFLGAFYFWEFWPNSDEEVAGVTVMIVVSILGIVGFIGYPARRSKQLTVACGGLLCLLGLLALVLESMGYILVISSSIGTALAASGLLRPVRSPKDGPQARKILYPRAKAPQKGPDGAPAPPAKDGPGAGSPRP